MVLFFIRAYDFVADGNVFLSRVKLHNLGLNTKVDLEKPTANYNAITLPTVEPPLEVLMVDLFDEKTGKNLWLHDFEGEFVSVSGITREGNRFQAKPHVCVIQFFLEFT